MAPLPHDSASRLEAGRVDYQAKVIEEKVTSAHSDSLRPIPTTTREGRGLGDRMPSAGRFSVMLLLSLLVTLGVASAAVSPRPWLRQPCPAGNAALQEAVAAAEGEDASTFRTLLETASPHSLHELLHKYFPERFKHGVWESDVSAVEALHRVDETMAVNIVQMAKRQDNGTTTSTSEPASTASTTSTPAPTTSNPPETTSTLPLPGTTSPTATSPTTVAPTTTAPGTTAPGTTEPGTSAPATTTPTTAAPDTSSAETTAAPPATTSESSSPASASSSSQEPSSSNSPTTSHSPSLTTSRGATLTGTSSSSALPETETSSSLVPVSAPFTSSSFGRGTTTTGPGITSRPGLSSTSRPLGDSTFTTQRPTTRPQLTSAELVTSTFTSTRADGGVVIVTATSYVSEAPQQTEAPTTSTRPAPSLQNAAPGRQSHRVAGVGAGIILGAAMLLI